MSEQNFFEKYGLELTEGAVSVGSTYPIFGVITQILEEKEDGSLLVELNRNIKAHMTVTDPEKVKLLKKRAFETGIFVSKVTSIEDGIEVECSTVVFGRPQTQEVQ